MDKQKLIEKILSDYKELVISTCPIVHESEILDGELKDILDKHLPDTQEPDVLGMLESLSKLDGVTVFSPSETYKRYDVYYTVAKGSRKRTSNVSLPEAIRQAYEQWKKVQG